MVLGRHSWAFSRDEHRPGTGWVRSRFTCVALGRLLHLSEPQFSHLQSESKPDTPKESRGAHGS